jgi:hypothetical protein
MEFLWEGGLCRRPEKDIDMDAMALERLGGLSPLESFEIFRDRIGHWCARRMDGKVSGTFFERDAAVRFARRECDACCGRHK